METSGERRAAIGRLTLGGRLRDFRHASGLTLDGLASEAGLSQSYLSDVERGRRLPSLEALDTCAVALGTTVASLLSGCFPWDSVPPPQGVAPPADGRGTWRSAVKGPAKR